ncbi:hypothetical protein PAMP_005882 [Pampus punctatissimus]
MDLTRLAVDAGQFINRAVQYTGESLGQADRTELDPGLEELLSRADATKTWTDQIISQTEVFLQPNPGARLEDRLFEHLDWSIPSRPLAHENERKMLLNKRLDLDIAKTRLRKAHEAERESRSLNANPLEDDYISHVSYMFSFLRVKWLKMWAQEISQAEVELRICQSLFDRQSEITRRLLEGISNTHINHMRSLTDFVEAQACYFAECNQHAQELQKQLASIPAVLCSNNWQSAITNAVNQPSISNHIANTSAGLNQVVHQLPEFDQDSWTANPQPGNEKATTVSSGQTNNNNNNKTFPTYSPANKALDHVCTSNSDSHLTVQLSAPSRNAKVAAEPPASSLTLKLSETAAITNSAGSVTIATIRSPSQFGGSTHEPQTETALSPETQTINDTAAEPQIANKTQSMLPSINREDIKESSSGSQDVPP